MRSLRPSRQTDLAAHPDHVFVPILAWAKTAQPEIERDAIKFKADILSNDLIDLSIDIPLTERVLVGNNDDGNYTTEHLAERQPEWNLPDPILFKELWDKNGTLTPDE